MPNGGRLIIITYGKQSKESKAVTVMQAMGAGQVWRLSRAFYTYKKETLVLGVSELKALNL